VTESAALVRSDVTVTAAPVVVSESIVAAAACVVAVPTPTVTVVPEAIADEGATERNRGPTQQQLQAQYA